MKPREFARAYGISAGAVYQAIKDDRLPHVRVNGRIVILVRQFEAMAQGDNPADSAGASTD